MEQGTINDPPMNEKDKKKIALRMDFAIIILHYTEKMQQHSIILIFSLGYG